MDFDFSPEQQQLSDAIARWIEKNYSFDQRKQIIHSDAGISEPAWQALAELGVLALPVPSQHEGFDGTPVDQMVVMQALGRALVVEPVFATALGAQFLTLGGGHGELLARVASGGLKLACALNERQARHELQDIAVTARRDGDVYVIDGEKTGVLHGAQAGQLIVSARSSGAQRDEQGISLFVIPAQTAGVSIRDARSNDGLRIATVRFSGVRVAAGALLGAEGKGWGLLDVAADHGAVLLCAEALGAMEALQAATLEYIRTRQQFGVPIGKFQVLQHRMADMFMQLEQARSMTMLAAVKVSSSDAVERRRIVSAAKARVGEAMTFIGQHAVQLHGGMGVTNEMPAAHYFKRLSAIELTLGDTDHHLARFIAQPGFAQAA
ncbi:MAG: acyl-CoA dehydrogenase family protein [Oxalobacteraceae bacterium]